MNIRKNAHYRNMVRIAYAKAFLESWEGEWKPLIVRFNSDAKSASEYIWNNRNQFKYAGIQRINQLDIKDKIDIIGRVVNLKDIEDIDIDRFMLFFAPKSSHIAGLNTQKRKRDIKEIFKESGSLSESISPLWVYINKAMIEDDYNGFLSNYEIIENRVRSSNEPKPEEQHVREEITEIPKVAAYGVVMEYLYKLDIGN